MSQNSALTIRKKGLHRNRQWSFNNLDRLADHLEAGTAGPNEREIIILGSFSFAFTLDPQEYTGGENIWATSTLQAYEHYGYTMVLGFGHMETLYIYQALHDMVKIVIWNDHQVKTCMERNATNYKHLETLYWEDQGDWQTGYKGCIATEEFPTGIPLWKSFTQFFFNDPQTPLGPLWTLSPYDLPGKGNFHTGYSVEHTCMKIPVPKVKEHRVFILSKRTAFFTEKFNTWWGFLTDAIAEVPPIDTPEGPKNFTYVAGFANKNKDGPETIDWIENIGLLTQQEWQKMVAASKVLLGIGRPTVSPSPYDALCMGVPFINPIFRWDKKNPDDRKKWYTQQEQLNDIPEPYVYHVRKGDRKGLVEALKKAVTTPIDRYIPEKARRDYVFQRHKLLVTHDWRAECNKYVDEHLGEESRYMCKWGETKFD